MAEQPISPLAQYMAYNDRRIEQLSQPRGSDLDPMAMLALAQGFLSPTRTGSFGESVGNAAGMAIGPLSKARAADADRLEKIDKLRETQVRLVLEQQRINDLNKRAAAGYGGDPILDYSRAMAGLEREASMIGDPNALDLDTNTPEGKAEKERRLQERAAITNQMKALRGRYFSGAGAGPAAASSKSDEPVSTETEPPRRSGSAGGAPDFVGSDVSGGGARQPAAKPSGAAPKAGRIASDVDLEAARSAYKRGASIDAILKRFKDNGITGINPEDITGGK